MFDWVERCHALIVLALAAALLALPNVVSAENHLAPLERSGANAVSIVVAQVSPNTTISRRPAEVLRPEHVNAIQHFIGAINDHRTADAVDMLSTELVPDQASRRQWLRQFSAIKSISIVSIEPSTIGTEGSCFEYKVKLKAHVSADPNSAIPNYGWEENLNYRWIQLCPDGKGAWTISSLGTGP
jgi:hypothetical protein